MNYIVLDTETTNGYIDENGKLNLDDSLTYDVSYVVINKKGEVLKSNAFVISEIFLDKELMSKAFFADKIPMYWNDIKNGYRKLVNFYTARKTLMDDFKNFECDFYSAHNSSFDVRALTNTQRFLTGSKYRYFFKYGTKVFDTLESSKATICKTEEYINFCKENGYMTKHKNPQVRATAEVIHRYLSGNNEFIEVHCGLEDCMIEKDILIKCLEMMGE